MADAKVFTPPGPMPSAVVEVVDTMPTEPPKAWWQDPWKAGLVALGAVVFLSLLLPPRRP